ncbi:hypothetical protein SAMN05216464_102425 [Mucilaginibacter pineti]|uniref:N-terminal double-transmembrane domain-containing protein n=1 Tax=Mucilaginibacter pineti TaxID=1391627 RepID=A0A1G6X9L4_9SPHI|nr:hypothetical protein [Mucilaginibacter pineti]SDD73975.1 hypothetical protein SAMN05216464_102425 [Mucilaginibacter pineti]
MNWSSIVIIICILTGVFAVWREYARAKKTRLLWRIIAVVAAITALACIALQPTYQTNATLQYKHEAVLVTDGFNADSLSKFNTKLFTTSVAIKKEYPGATLINNVEEVIADPTITQLHILGNGLYEEELQQLNNLPVIFNPKEFTQGITAINWNQRLKTGDKLIIQGRYKNTSAQKVKLVLRGLSTNLDSVDIDRNNEHVFELQTIPKTAGKTIYNLLVISNKDTIEKEDLPLQTEPVRPLRVLMLTASPDFESRFLKNWLSENGYAVAVRSAISKDKFNKEYINTEQLPLDHLTAGVLNKFDVLLGDLSVLKSLNGAEASALKIEVTQKGIGLIIRADSTLKSSSWLQTDFPLDRLAAKDSISSSLLIQGIKDKTAKIIPGAVYINYQNGTQPLVIDGRGHIVVSSALSGAGKMLFTSLNNTFSWMLAGDKNDYTTLWSRLIHEGARKSQATESWDVLTALPVSQSAVKLQLMSALPNPSATFGPASVAFEQDAMLPFEHTAIYWPQSSGWQSVKQTGGLQNWWYTYGNDNWKGLQILKRETDTRNYIAKHTNVSNVTKEIHQKLRIAIPKIYFYVLLLLASIFLWAEAKLS